MLREPIQIVELYQPRCSLRFGVSPCTAQLDRGPRCYNCWGTCLDRANYTADGGIYWRFIKPREYLPKLFEQSGEIIKTDPLPLLKGVSARSAKINIGSSRTGEKPLGVTGSTTIEFQDAPFDDHVGDYYKDLRTYSGGNFWAKFLARNPFYANMRVTIYEGYIGQTLAEMDKRVSIVENFTGPNSNGAVTLTAVDPLKLTDASRASFPPETVMELSADIDAVSTSIVIESSDEDNLTMVLGNTATKYIVIGSEIIKYTGYTGSEGVWTLSGVSRAQLGTTAASHSAGDKAQRVGRYESMAPWLIAEDLIKNHSEIPNEFVPIADWITECEGYIPSLLFERTQTKPMGVNELLGELMRDGTMYIWWDEWEQEIKLKVIRPEVSTTQITDNEDIVAGSAELRREPDDRISRVFVYYDQIDPTKGDDPTNFRKMRGWVSADVENEDAGAEIRSKTIYSKWIKDESQATELASKLVNRFGYTPQYLAITLTDGTFRIGQVFDVTSKTSVDTEGRPKTLLWQVIAAQEVRPGESVQYQLQEFLYQASRFGKWMADGSLSYSDTDPEVRDSTGAWWTDDEGLMPDGKAGYLWS